MAEDVVWGGREQILADREFIQELDRSGYRFKLLRFEGFQLFDFQEPLMLQIGLTDGVAAPPQVRS